MPHTVVLLLLLTTACQRGQPPSPYLRVTEDSGRIYYADQRTLFHSPTAGFLSFRDLVTNESVRLPEGTYRRQEVPFSEIELWRQRYMYNPSRRPHVENDP